MYSRWDALGLINAEIPVEVRSKFANQDCIFIKAGVAFSIL
jgi:hypothetical protein